MFIGIRKYTCGLYADSASNTAAQTEATGEDVWEIFPASTQRDKYTTTASALSQDVLERQSTIPLLHRP